MAEKAKFILEFDGKKVKVLDDATKELKKVDDQSRKTSGGLNKLGQSFAGLLGAGAAFKVLMDGLTKSFEAAGVQEKAVTKLNQALMNTGNFSKAASQDLQSYASALQRTTTFGDEVTISAMSQIAMYGVQGESLKQVTALTQDFATAQGVDLNSAAQLVGKTLGSSTNALARYGVEVTGAVGSNERLQSTLDGLSKVFGGQAAAQAQTFTGRMQIMKNAIGDVQEEIGSAFAPVLIRTTAIMTASLQTIGDLVTKYKDFVIPIIAVTGAFTGLIAAVAAFNLLAPVLASTIAILTGPIGIAIGLIAGIVLAITNWNTITQTLAQTWQIFSEAFMLSVQELLLLFQNFGMVFQMIMTGQFKPAVELAEKTWNRFSTRAQSSFSKVVGSIKGNVGDMVSSVTTGISDVTESFRSKYAEQTAISAASVNAQKSHAQQLSLFKQQLNDLEVQNTMTKQQALGSILTNLSALQRSESIKAFEVGKAAAISKATVDTFMAANAAFAALAGIPIIGPALAAAASAAAIAAGFVNVNAISRQRMPKAETGAFIPGTPGGTPIIVGERNKPEVVLPLDRATRSAQGLGDIGGGTTLNVNISGPLYADEKLPHNLALKIDRALEQLRMNDDSALALGIKGSL